VTGTTEATCGSVRLSSVHAVRDECNAMRFAVRRWHSWEGVVKITKSNDDSSVVGCGQLYRLSLSSEAK
jgi:hypothetical protein